ncbi:D-alanyl-D-alanine carboxypeptidase family protein [Streptomyces sp. Tue6028]|uniref:D-alanyl-D-alanine carboxypeptidase family protein n=1 Tax=Streptomyces sp. Tue6028 TaxID=2036037 RepID=UPI000BB2D3FF|nr:D-alanyl-D-alanine carboxypeptidase [Streptomyces sp. Tue6028]
MRDSSPRTPRSAPPSPRAASVPAARSAVLSRRAALGLAAAVPLAVSGVPAASAATTIGGERLGRGGVQVLGGSALPERLTARAWLVADHESGEVLAAYDAHRRLAPASTLKMLFADTVLKRFERTETRKATDGDLADVPAGSSLVGIKPGITYTVEQLWQGVFLRSGNDAVHVLSHMNGGIAVTVAQMQARARDLQALDTHVVSPDGFDHKGQLSSAYDLTLFARHGLADADFRGYCATKTADFPAGGKKTFQIQNTDRLLTGAWGVRPYDGLIGVKNGYTSHAGNTFTGAATHDGRTLLVTVMHPKNGGSGVYEETAQLLDWGFANAAKVRPVGRLVEPLSEGGASATPARKAPKAAAGASAAAAGPASAGPSWGLFAGAGGAAALLAGGAFALRGRRRAVTGEDGEAGSARHRR